MKKVTFFVANSCLNGSSFLILRATQSQNMFTRLQMKSRYVQFSGYIKFWMLFNDSNSLQKLKKMMCVL